jgi:cytochrome P450
MIPHVHSLQNEPTIPEHNRRRRDWDPAFSLKSLATYESNITRNMELLMEQIARLAAKGPVNVKECMLWFGFDVMGELGFGRSFGTLEAASTSEVVHLVEFGVRAINTVGNVPYLAHIMRFLPSPIAKFESWLEEAVKWRIAKQGDREYVPADVFAFLLGEEGKQKRKLDKRELQQDCMLLVVAGSDTTSNTLALCLYEMAKQPQLIERLRGELEQITLGDYNALRDEAPLLNACLKETLRLWPPVPSGLQRTTLQPMTLPSGRVVPPNTVLSTHTFTLHRDSRNFTRPERFMPDRWLKEPKKGEVHNVKAFSPFGYGTTSCIVSCSIYKNR